jgi:glycosidase
MKKTVTASGRREAFKDLVVYQIYTRSFADSNGDGIGDFVGVIGKLDYLAWLGIDVIWLSPFCASPNKDNGYDVSDYRNVMAEFGTLDDLDRLIAEAHDRNILVMMDLVMNHSSVEHPWFRSRPEYYYWTDKPNNWDSYFHDSAWTWDEERGQYYLHLFYPEQPDLNWENPELRREMHDIARFWLQRGIDAFRLDAIHHIGKPDGLPDAPEPRAPDRFRNFKNTSRTHRYLQDFNREVIAGSGAFTVGETGGTTPRTSRLYVDRSRRELDMIFLFDHLWKMQDDLRNIGKILWPVYRQLSVDGWNSRFFGNHDFARPLSILGSKTYVTESASAMAVFLLTLWGTPFIYQGEEIGMTNANFDSLDDYDCAAAKRHYHHAVAEGHDPDLAFAEFQRRTRDNARTPMQWDDGPNAGFSSGEPWMKVNANYPTVGPPEKTLTLYI